MMHKFPVLEIFGPTIQGEGMVVGRKTNVRPDSRL